MLSPNIVPLAAACTFASGTLVFWISSKVREKSRKSEIQRLARELDQLRDQHCQEAAERIEHIIRLMNRQGMAAIDLRRCYLANRSLSLAQLDGADLREADLEGADLRGAQLDGARLQKAHLSNANLYGASLRNANLKEAYLGGATLKKADLYKANLQKAQMSSVDLENAYLNGARLDGVFLKNAKLFGIWLTDRQISKLKTLFRAKMDDNLISRVKAYYPHLQDDPQKYFLKHQREFIAGILNPGIR